MYYLPILIYGAETCIWTNTDVRNQKQQRCSFYIVLQITRWDKTKTMIVGKICKWKLSREVAEIKDILKWTCYMWVTTGVICKHKKLSC
jgi:hypothetical protein